MKIEWETCARIVAQEVRRLRGHLIGGWIAPEDLTQELSIVALQSAGKHDGRENTSYVRTSVRNAIRSLYEQAYVAKRFPQDRYGQPISFASYDDKFSLFGAIALTPEDELSNRQQLKLIADQLSIEDKREFMRFATGEEEIDLKFVRRILGEVNLSSM